MLLRFSKVVVNAKSSLMSEKHTFLAVSFYLSKEEVRRRKKRKEKKERKKERKSYHTRAKEAIFCDAKTRNFLVTRTHSNVIYETVNRNTIFSACVTKEY
jgi:hypothetical protein